MARNSENYYFKTFVNLVDFSCQAAELLYNVISRFDEKQLTKKIDEMHVIEHSADVAKHEMTRALAKEFITPIDREDIIQLSQEIDDVTDAIEDVLLRIYMFNITEIRSEAMLFTEKIVQCCEALKRAMQEFHNFKKSKTIHNLLVEIDSLEEECDKIYTDAVRRLYVESDNTMEIIKWRETFDRFERCCDSCEHVANVVESVIMKNS